jgi:DNA-binding cell septation regulator SpoVG
MVYSSAGLRCDEAVEFGGKLTLSPRLGSLSVKLGSRLIIYDLRIMVGSNGSQWITVPGRNQIDRDGRPGLVANRKPTLSDVIEFREKATRDRFQDQVLELTRTGHPEAFRSGEQ